MLLLAMARYRLDESNRIRPPICSRFPTNLIASASDRNRSHK